MSQIRNQGLSATAVLGIVFVILKLVGVIHWSWWLVLLPFYFGLAAFIAIMGILLLAAIITTVVASIFG